jgi:hypothetical protein
MAFRVRIRKAQTVHMAKAMDGSEVTTRCLLVVRQRPRTTKREWTVWEKEVTCRHCQQEVIIWEDE